MRVAHRIAVAIAGLAAALAGAAGMGLVREQAAGLDGGPILQAEPCRGVCVQTFTFDRAGWAITCTALPDDAVTGAPLAIASGIVREVRPIDGIDGARALAITGPVCVRAGWSLAVPLDAWRPAGER